MLSVSLAPQFPVPPLRIVPLLTELLTPLCSEESQERKVVSLTGPASSPFLFTRYVRPLTVSVEQHLSGHGAKMFASLWSSQSPPGDRSGAPASRRVGVCELPPEWSSTGGCGARIPQWTYNSTTGHCQPFWYSGCGATSNLHSNERKCRLQCSHQHSGG